jgi:hypothetical protein
MVVGIFGLLLDSAVFLVRRGSEECGAKLVVRLKQTTTIFPEQSGVAKEEMISLVTRRGKRPLWTGMSDLV